MLTTERDLSKPHWLDAVGQQEAAEGGEEEEEEEETDQEPEVEEVAEKAVAVVEIVSTPAMSNIGPIVTRTVNPPQPTVISGPKKHTTFATIRLSRKAVPTEVAAIAATISDIADGIVSADSSSSSGDDGGGSAAAAVEAGVGFSSGLWNSLPVPTAPIPFKHHHRAGSKKRGGGPLPSTGGDLLVHLKCARARDCDATLQQLLAAMPAGAVANTDVRQSMAHATGAFGFKLGAGNPKSVRERSEVALVPAFHALSGSSYALHQRWVHNQKALRNASTPQLEQAVGRSRAHDRQLGAFSLAGSSNAHQLERAVREGLPASSHLARVTLSRSGHKQQLYRQSAPYAAEGGSGQEEGLLFMAYCATPDTFHALLDRMAAADDVMAYSTCVTGNLWFFPSAPILRSLRQSTDDNAAGNHKQ